MHDGDCAAAWYQKGLVLFNQEQFDEALPAFERSLALAPSIQDYAFRKALTYYMLERFPDAVTTFELRPYPWSGAARLSSITVDDP